MILNIKESNNTSNNEGLKKATLKQHGHALGQHQVCNLSHQYLDACVFELVVLEC